MFVVVELFIFVARSGTYCSSPGSSGFGINFSSRSMLWCSGGGWPWPYVSVLTWYQSGQRPFGGHWAMTGPALTRSGH